MLTPFTEANEVDYPALEQLVDWYISKGVHGLFAVCQSSEMVALTLDERINVARFVKEKAAGRVPVVASGHISETMEGQLEEVREIAATGVDAFVLVCSRLAAPEESEEVWKRNTATILERNPDVAFGLYECPAPYHRLMSPDTVKWCADTDRFLFMKETSSNSEQNISKVAAARGSSFKIYNTNGTTLLPTLRAGANGYSGIMANFHPDLYVWLVENWDKQPEKAERLQTILGTLVLFEGRQYPTSSKFLLQQEGLAITLHSRVRPAGDFRLLNQIEIKHLRNLHDFVQETLQLELAGARSIVA
jgi:4-hydroxy-tetrahydrodipicolinate synthase